MCDAHNALLNYKNNRDLFSAGSAIANFPPPQESGGVATKKEYPHID
jgi:hypothetical protein